MPHILASFGVLTYSQEKNIKKRLQLTGYRLSCIGYRWPLSVRHHTSAIKHILVTVFLCFSFILFESHRDWWCGYRILSESLFSNKVMWAQQQRRSLKQEERVFLVFFKYPQAMFFRVFSSFSMFSELNFCVRLSNFMSPPSRKPY